MLFCQGEFPREYPTEITEFLKHREKTESTETTEIWVNVQLYPVGISCW